MPRKVEMCLQTFTQIRTNSYINTINNNNYNVFAIWNAKKLITSLR